MKALKSILLIGFVLVFSLSPIFADGTWGSDYKTAEGETVTNPFGLAFRFLEMLLVSAATGALISARFIINMVKAYYASDTQEGVYKRELIKVLTTIGIVMMAGTILGFITGWIPV